MKHALLLAALIAAPVSVSAQTVTLYEPVPDPVMLPIERDEAGVVKAQYIKPGDVTPEQYQRLLEEAEKVRAYYGQGALPTTITSPAPVAAPSAPIASQLPASPATPVVSANIATQTHTVIKGDTLFNIAKRNAVSVEALRKANGLADNNIKLGQALLIPTRQTVRTVVRPTSAYNTHHDVYQAAQTPAVADLSSKPYAVAPGDTLYSIAKRACTSVDLLQSGNNLSGTNISPGKKLALPAGHCLK